MKKICTKCKILKSYSEFYVDKKSKDGLSYNCKDCVREYKVKNKEHIKLYRKKYNIKLKLVIS